MRSVDILWSAVHSDDLQKSRELLIIRHGAAVLRLSNLHEKKLTLIDKRGGIMQSGISFPSGKLRNRRSLCTLV